ncbi:MAG: type I-E CRISPR-associated protein Cas7/Cse4/CasC [Candidatus Thiodiazotropha sp. (ex Lucinoma kastoroae)]|nr:type I-E CRISPR-associated protein Cas7/Cse4/CasC [Candidatus Thiodiazotropha sp. (ex Lucinoma kastoroae)]
MSEKNFFNIHVLISHSPSCLNRDDMNMQKSVIFGGARRVRISSQSLKRAMRKSDYYRSHLGDSSLRTRDITRLKSRFINALSDRYSEEQISTAIDLFYKKEKKEETKEQEKGVAVAPWAISEIGEVCRIIAEAGPEADEKALHKAVANNLKGLRTALNDAVDIALSGRMATSGLMTSVDGAMALAHPITTHPVEAEIDWFTAVDDLVTDEGDVGAGHLNTQEFSSGVFYRYASINIGQLQKNLGEVEREKALEVIGHVVRMMAAVIPSAKQQAFAAHNLADLVVASFSDLPLSLANAFEKPVNERGGGLMAPSVKALVDYWNRMKTGYGFDERAKVFSLVDGIEISDSVPSLDQLQMWVNADGKV